MVRQILNSALVGVFLFNGQAWTREFTSDDLFDDSVVHTIHLFIHPSDWEKLKKDYLEDKFYPASLEWRDLVVDNIGIRSRGNGSRSGNKPGLKLDFNRYEPNQKFLGLKALVLDNLTQDPGMMAERLSMLLFRKMGLPAPRVAHVRLLVNNVYLGLYTLVERVDKDFLKRNVGEDGGYLYDYEWASEYWFEYLGPDPSTYSPSPFEPQTHEKNPDSRPIERMIRLINQSSDEEFVEVVSPYLDLKLFLDYLATETVVADVDGLLGQWGLNNFYLYRFQGQNLSMFIPWDKDVTFGAVDRSIWENAERNVLTRRVFSNPELREYFLQALERCLELVGGPGGWLETEIEREYRQIRLAALEDPNKPFSYSDFEHRMEHLRYFAFERPRLIINQIADSRAARLNQ